ncbi:MAG TPA: DUF664 domain-containing protein [Gemmatimonadaceae bacterium]|nr:DUF664 domain-containing protein [Gemmatimonadaceae bacterium]
MPSPSTLLVPAPGYTPLVGAIVAMLGYARETTLAAVDGLTAADLEHRHDARANSIGALLAHVAATEWYFQSTTLERRAPEGAEWAEWGAALRLGAGAETFARGHDVAWHRERLGALRERTLMRLRDVDDAWLAGEFELPWLRQPATHHWAWFHVAEDELNHRGQIRWLRSRLPGQASAGA